MLQAVGARDAARAAAFAAAHGVARSYGSYAELVADPDVDVVYVATTHAQHHEHALLALGAGKPVLVEKAFTLNARQAREIVAVPPARPGCSAWKRCGCASTRWCGARRQIVASGRIGEHRQRAGRLVPPLRLRPARTACSILPPVAARCSTSASIRSRFAWLFLGQPDSASRSPGPLAQTGSDATVAMQWAIADGASRPDLLHERGVAEPVRGDRLRHRRLVAARAADAPAHQADRQHAPTAMRCSSEPIVGNGYGYQIAEVERCLRAGETESPLVPLDETVAILELLDEVRAAARRALPADDGARLSDVLHRSRYRGAGRSRRGGEQVSLEWLGDRLRDFVDANPEFETAVDRLATWLARADDDDSNARQTPVPAPRAVGSRPQTTVRPRSDPAP